MHVPEPHRTADLAVSGTLSTASLISGVWAAFAELPAGSGIAICGIIGSVAIQLGRMFFDDARRRLEDRNASLHEIVAAAEDREAEYQRRIRELVKQVDDHAARSERLMGVLMQHAPKIPNETLEKVGEAVAPSLAEKADVKP